jgi:hypothetical protein
MNSRVPVGLTESVRNEAIPIRDDMVQAGWIFSVIHSDNERERKLAFTATSPKGHSVYVASEERDLPNRLRLLRQEFSS